MKIKYIYDLNQANFFIERGEFCIGVDVHYTTKKVFLKFKDSARFQEIFNEWLTVCNQIKESEVNKIK